MEGKRGEGDCDPSLTNFLGPSLISALWSLCHAICRGEEKAYLAERKRLHHRDMLGHGLGFRVAHKYNTDWAWAKTNKNPRYPGGRFQ